MQWNQPTCRGWNAAAVIHIWSQWVGVELEKSLSNLRTPKQRHCKILYYKAKETLNPSGAAVCISTGLSLPVEGHSDTKPGVTLDLHCAHVAQSQFASLSWHLLSNHLRDYSRQQKRRGRRRKRRGRRREECKPFLLCLSDSAIHTDLLNGSYICFLWAIPNITVYLWTLDPMNLWREMTWS